MERKTIGQFIAALRRVSGMTQKQLAEKLNVSDKTISRWERDECAPDLTLIPVIAEVFGVTSDEILRGERVVKEAVKDREAAKTEKQLKRVLDSAMLSFKTRSIISVGIALLGLIGAMICNFGFLRAYIGFFVGLVFIVGASACEAVFGMHAFSAAGGDEFDETAVGRYKFEVVKGLEIAFSAFAVVFFMLFPLVLEAWDTYMGITADLWFAEGAIYAVISVIFSFLVCLFINIKLAIDYNIEPREISEKKRSLIFKSFKIAAIWIAVTLILQIAFNAVASTDVFAPKKEFESTEAFKEFMETPMDWQGNLYAVDAYSDEPSEWYIFDKKGNEIDSYYEWNESVSYVKYDWKKGDPLYIVYTHEAKGISSAITESVNYIFMVAYLVEIIVITIKARNSFKSL